MTWGNVHDKIYKKKQNKKIAIQYDPNFVKTDAKILISLNQ